MKREDISHLSLERLARLCAEHTQRFKAGQASDGRYCYELLLRAARGVAAAWEAVHTQYHQSLLDKIRRFSVDPAIAEDLVQETWIKFSNALTPSKFPNLAHALAYLDRCARSVALNYLRKSKRCQNLADALLEHAQSNPSQTHNPEHHVLDRESERAHDRWRDRVWECVSRKCQDALDRRLAELRWGYDLLPREIQARHPDEFPSLPELYKRLRNLKDRIKRDPDCSTLLDEMP
jgi:DNA-directed RNA polymerase specialized sigma24 family protein